MPSEDARHADAPAFDLECRDSLVDALVEMAGGDDLRERRVRELALDSLRFLAVRNLEDWQRVRTAQGRLAESELRTAAFLVDVLGRVCARFDATLRNH